MSPDELSELLDDANYILIEDTGHGMSLTDLEDIYLTIGTRYRLNQRNQQLGSRTEKPNSSRPVLGEKGIGRLSAMRLGWRIQVDTTESGEEHWNQLEIDWRRFDTPLEQFVGDVEITPTIGSEKHLSKYSGTRIRISALTSAWTSDKFRAVAKEFSKLTNPFEQGSRYPISLEFNGDSIPIPRLDRILFEQAHGAIRADYSVEPDGPRFVGKVNYMLRNREKAFSYDSVDLFGFTDETPVSVLQTLGPFSVEFYWFNRLILREVDGIGTRRQVQELVNEWSGGLMLFRDGFRVHPYGSPDDDWLDLDRRALASGGYKVNRKQIVGQVKLSALDNSSLVDQTNREGLRECPEKDALIRILKHLLEVDFRVFINQVDRETRAREPISFDELEERAANEETQMRLYIQVLLNKYPELRKDPQVIRPLEDSIAKIRFMLDEASEIAESYEAGRTQLLNLAGLGLMVEIVAHELNRATRYALQTLADAQQGETSTLNSMGRFATLDAQLKTLQKRLRILDPLSTSGRQVKERFDLIQWVDDILQSHEAQFERHRIKCTLTVQPRESGKSLPVRMVKGMVVQIVENLLSNAVYWLKQQKVLNRSFMPQIEIEIDSETKAIRITDNGPGVDPSRKYDIFQPFVTTKPPGQGKGLGLYVSQEIAKYHGAQLAMSDERTTHPDRLNTFVFSLEVTER